MPSGLQSRRRRGISTVRERGRGQFRNAVSRSGKGEEQPGNPASRGGVYTSLLVESPAHVVIVRIRFRNRAQDGGCLPQRNPRSRGGTQEKAEQLAAVVRSVGREYCRSC